MTETVSFLKSLNITDTYIIVGCSGGPDSMCLLNVLANMNYKIVCAHVDHGIREESASEYSFLEGYCQNRNITFEGMHIPEYLDENESYYRRARYEFYKKLAKKYDTPYIMTAHHGDDLVETILMRLTRGSNLKGYLGFRKIYDEKEFKFVKPLIYYTKDEILKYVKENDIPYVEDKTNDEDLYTRNRYRHHVLPFLKRESPNVHRKYLQFSEELAASCEYIDKLVIESIKFNYDGKAIDLTKFDELDEFIKRKELESIFQVIYKDDVDKLVVFHIDQILAQISKGKNFTIDLPLNIKVRREYSKLTIGTEEESKPFKFEFIDKLVLPTGDEIATIEVSDDTSNYTTRLNSKDLHFPLYIRTREEGDTIQIKNMEGTKKLKSVLIDEKVPASIRNEIPILADADGRILWIPGIKKSKFDVNKDGKYDIILKYTKKEGKY